MQYSHITRNDHHGTMTNHNKKKHQRTRNIGHLLDSSQTSREILPSTTASIVGRCITSRALALAILVGVGLLGVDASGASSKFAGISTCLVFRVEGSKDDPKFDRACGLVKGLEDLYGKERYRLQAINQIQHQERLQSPPKKLWGWTIPLPRWLCHKEESSSEQVQHPVVVCNITSGNDSGTLGVDESVTIGGVEDLMEFVRTSVLAGPRHFSFAYHERSLRLQGAHRRRKEVADVTSTASPSGVDDPRAPSPISASDAPDFYDLVVVGGGSGGLACAKEAARLGQRVVCLDFVKPSPAGTKWGLGGTCVNVGCIPKKLMHQASLIGGHVRDAEVYGWRLGHKDTIDSNKEGCGISSHDWRGMVQAVQNYIKGLNFKYRTDLRSKGVEYLNALGRLQDPNTVVATDKRGREHVLKCGKIVVAVGGRPKPLTCEGGDLAVTSDDIFSLPSSPGKTLVVGASYVALECAGFLTGLGIDTTVMVRSVLLRGFDQDIAERIGRFMQADGTRFIRPAVPRRISRTKEGRLLVSWENGGKGEMNEEEFDTILAATGRKADVQRLGLENVGVALSDDGKIICSNEETNVPGVFAIGDAVEGAPELTPTAIQAGKLLARRLFGGSSEAMDYQNVCTTVFTPLEYSCCGLSEDEAVEKIGQDNVEVYHSAFTPLEWDINPERPKNACYVKAVCDLSDRQRIVGLHFLGPNAGEVMQGFGVGVRLGMTHDDLRQLVGIHPTAAEEMTLLQTTKRSGEPIEKSSC